MKYLLILFAPFLIACGEKNGIRLVNVSDNDCITLNSTVWQPADSGRFYYDLRITEDYYAFLDNKTDTLIRVYKRDDPHVLHNFYVKKNRNILDTKFQFVKSDTRTQTAKNQLKIIENRAAIKVLNLDDKNNILSPSTDFSLRRLPPSIDYNPAKNEAIYAVPLAGKKGSPYYIFSPDSGYTHVKIYEYKDVKYPETGHAYLACLAVDEASESVVAAQRFMNNVIFYDLHGTIKTVASFGKERVVPSVKDSIELKNSLKCFIYICGTAERVYCLYDGSLDYTAKSKIVVFDRSGKHIATYQTDRALKQIAVSADGSTIVALAAGEHGGRDVALYDIK